MRPSGPTFLTPQKAVQEKAGHWTCTKLPFPLNESLVEYSGICFKVAPAWRVCRPSGKLFQVRLAAEEAMQQSLRV